MGNNSSVMLQNEEIEEIQRETGCKFFRLFYLITLFISLF